MVPPRMPKLAIDGWDGRAYIRGESHRLGVPFVALLESRPLPPQSFSGIFTLRQGFKVKFCLNKGFGIEAFRYQFKLEKTFRELFVEYSLEMVTQSLRRNIMSVVLSLMS